MPTNEELVHGNQLITDFIFGKCTKFFNSDIEETMKKLLSGFRYSGHVTKNLIVRDSQIRLETKHGTFEVLWNDAIPGYYVGVLYVHSQNQLSQEARRVLSRVPRLLPVLTGLRTHPIQPTPNQKGDDHAAQSL